jgi:hypothetical protein
MPVYLCRWPNGDCSFVSAPTKEKAIEKLDQYENAEGCVVRRLAHFQIHLKLTDEGHLELDESGIWSWNAVMAEPDLYDLGYPILRNVVFRIFEETDNKPFTPEQQERVRKAVRRERRRVRWKEPPPPETELGKDVKTLTSMPTSLVNKIVKHAATKRLRTFAPKGKPN